LAKPLPKPSVTKKTPVKKRGPYRSWNEGDRKKAMDAAVQAKLEGKDPVEAARAIIPFVDIPRQTLADKVDEVKGRVRYLINEDAKPSAMSNYDRHKSVARCPRTAGRKSLTTKQFRTDLQRMICARDELNNGMTRKEVIGMIYDFHGVSAKTAGNHYDYLITHNLLPDLKRGGRVVSAQATTTNRTATTTEKLLRGYTNFNVALGEVRAMNREHDKDGVFPTVEDHFVLNLDESNFSSAEGNLKVIGSRGKKKCEKNTSDSRESVTAVRIGSAAGTEVSIACVIY
jgi:hypothetical protein